MASFQHGRTSKLLATLDESTLERVLGSVEEVTLAPAARLASYGQVSQALYFPVDSVVALGHTDSRQRTAAVALVGPESVAGSDVLLASDISVHEVTVIVGGRALRVARGEAEGFLSHGGAFQRLMLRSAHAVLTQISFTAVCERIHSIEQRLTRWLLLIDDRVAPRPISLSHEVLASIMGVRREGVTEAAGNLQRQNLIHYRRGVITIVNRSALELGACECYAGIKTEYDRLLLQGRFRGDA
ncbi:MAG: Crp/Fnr family transcriptional regulator [Pseudomonadota bacterium]|nr:Crp/Fnr family transcriptional regulator [Pseudomonadota bacterium]